MNKLSALATTVTLVLASAAFAAPKEQLQPLPSTNAGVATLITGLVVFTATAIFLGTVVWPKISKGLADREHKIRHEIESAEAARVQAKMALDGYEKSLAEARTQAQKMIDVAKTQMNSQVAEMKAKADTEVATMKAKAMGEIEAAKKQALSELYSQSSTLATQVAGKILRREVSGGDNQRLVDEALAGMSRN